MNEPFIQVDNLSRVFSVRRGTFRRVHSLRAVLDVSFTVPRGGTFGLVGESGSGKSTIAKMVMGALPPSSGQIRIADIRVDQFEAAELARLRRVLQPVLQDPYSSLNPAMRIGAIIAEPMRIQRLAGSSAERSERVEAAMRQVGLRPEMRHRFPNELSGGQRQRVAIARSLAMQPDSLVLDEPVSALDVSVQAQILNLLKDLQQEKGLTYLLISHDLAVVSFICTTIGVLYLGQFMELGSRDSIIHDARHPYTQILIATADPSAERRQGSTATDIRGEIPSPLSPPGGCPFHTRCPLAVNRCKGEKPALREVAPGHMVACHFA